MKHENINESLHADRNLFFLTISDKIFSGSKQFIFLNYVCFVFTVSPPANVMYFHVFKNKLVLVHFVRFLLKDAVKIYNVLHRKCLASKTSFNMTALWIFRQWRNYGGALGGQAPLVEILAPPHRKVLL